MQFGQRLTHPAILWGKLAKYTHSALHWSGDSSTWLWGRDRLPARLGLWGGQDGNEPSPMLSGRVLGPCWPEKGQSTEPSMEDICVPAFPHAGIPGRVWQACRVKVTGAHHRLHGTPVTSGWWSRCSALWSWSSRPHRFPVAQYRGDAAAIQRSFTQLSDACFLRAAHASRLGPSCGLCLLTCTPPASANTQPSAAGSRRQNSVRHYL